ncbi:MAG: D-inositol-3-phosphate glycosyltransferase [Anaerolineae bacterium]|nr:D-inositol-3-phosphate glycosyltransferase [Anaerolineae bacterium]
MCYNGAMNTIRIGLNAHLLSLSQSYRGAGISWYIVNLLKNLGRMSPPGFDYTAFLADRAFAGQADGLSLQFSRLPTQRPVVRIFWEQFIQPLALRRAGIDLLHALAFVAPAASPCPYVVTVYDLSFIRYPEAFRPFNRWYLRYFTGRTVQRARAVIAISESTRQDVINFLGVPPERVHTIYCGSDAAFQPLPLAQIDAFKAAQNLPADFVLFLGTLEPRKNIEGLIRAYALWRKQQPSAPPLIIAGGQGWYYQHIFNLVKELNLTDTIRFPGYVPQESLPLWYNAASLFVYPSHFEGFGLPVLEAMACGTPVITSTAASLPEVAGNAARLIDPGDAPDLAAAMAQVYNQPELRQHMTAAGLARAAQFSWQATAQNTVAIYQKVTANETP